MSQSAECSTSYSSEPMSQPTWWGWASRKLVAQAESACHDISKEQRRCEYEDGADGVRFLQCRTVITQFRVCQDMHHNQVPEQISVKVVETREPVDAVKQSSPEPAQSPQPEQHAQAHLPSIDHEGLPPQVAIFMDDFLNFANELERNPVIRGLVPELQEGSPTPTLWGRWFGSRQGTGKGRFEHVLLEPTRPMTLEAKPQHSSIFSHS